MYLWWLHILLYVSMFSGKLAELFSDLAGMEAMVETERVLLDSLHTYLKNQENQLKLLRKRYDDYNAEYQMAKKDETQYLGNPVSAFKIIKRLQIDWKDTQRIIECSTPIELLPKDIRELYAFPGAKDLSSAAEGLVRLQEVYNLDALELAEGKINGMQYSSWPMTASDCFGLGRQLFELQFYMKSFEWLNIALSKYEAEYDKTVDKVDILDFLAISAYALGNFKTAVDLTNKVLKIVPDHRRSRKNLPIFELTLEIVINIFEGFVDLLHMAIYYNEQRKTYYGLCREELELPEVVKKELKCRYISESHPFLRIAPFKLEELYVEPYVAVFHDVLYDDEIQLIKELVHPHLERSAVNDPLSEEGTISKVRISMSGWLKDEEHAVAARVSRRTAHFTGLAMESAEDLQVAVYGLAGHYETHFDFSRKDEISEYVEENQVGERIATVLFYMSDVADGGNTIFPDIGVSVKPEKGMALFWLNLLPSGEGNYASRHAACPVLRGSKYVCTKWIRQAGQELLKPCTLEYQEEGTYQEFPKPVKKQAPLK